MGVKARKRHKYKPNSGLTGMRRGRTMTVTFELTAQAGVGLGFERRLSKGAT